MRVFLRSAARPGSRRRRVAARRAIRAAKAAAPARVRARPPGNIGVGGERDGVFNLPPNIRFGVTALTNAANDQTIDIYIGDNPKPAATFKGAGVEDQNLGTKVLDSGKGRVRVIVTVNGKPSRLGSRQVDLFKKSYFGIVGSEDGTDDDYNDGIVFLNWPLG